MSDSLSTYLHDHLSGANFAIDLLETLRDQHAGEPVGEFAASLLVEIAADRQVLQEIIDKVGENATILKEASAWIGEKVSQIKLRRDVAGHLGSFESIETLSLGIMGKLALWRALPEIAQTDTRVPQRNYSQLAERAQIQFAQAEKQRLLLVPFAFGPEKD